MFTLKDQVLFIVAPHPDDEVLGCGGLIQKVKKEGGKTFVLFMTVGNTKDYSEKGNSSQEERIKEIEKVSNYLGFDGWEIAFPGNEFHLKLDSIPQKDLIDKIEKGQNISLNALKPTIIATPKITDYNQDHQASSRAVFSATRPAPSDFKPLQRLILEYDSTITAEWAWGNVINPNLFIELTEEDLEEKIKAMELYGSQIREGFHQRSAYGIKTNAYFRGFQSGLKAAEAFSIKRLII